MELENDDMTERFIEWCIENGHDPDDVEAEEFWQEHWG